MSVCFCLCFVSSCLYGEAPHSGDVMHTDASSYTRVYVGRTCKSAQVRARTKDLVPLVLKLNCACNTSKTARMRACKCACMRTWCETLSSRAQKMLQRGVLQSAVPDPLSPKICFAHVQQLRNTRHTYVIIFVEYHACRSCTPQATLETPPPFGQMVRSILLHGDKFQKSGGPRDPFSLSFL